MLTDYRRGVADQHGADRCVVGGHRRDRVSHCREHGFQHAVGVLVDGLDAQAQPGEVLGYPEGLAGRELRAHAGGDDDVFEQACSGKVGLPVIAHRAGNGADAGVIRIGHALYPCAQQRANFGGEVIDRRQAYGFGVQAIDQNNRLIVELQALDTAEPVGTVGADVVNDHVVARTRCGFQDGVVRQQAREFGRVEVEAAGARQDFPDDLQLPGVVGAVEHKRHQRHHAVERGDLIPGRQTIGIDAGAHADAHVEPLVAVDDVVAGTALDDVAAVATEDDVARAEGGHGGAHGVVEQCLQAGDQGDIGQHAALGTGVGDQRCIGIVAMQDVAMGRARQAFHFLEACQDAGRYWSWRYIDGTHREVNVDTYRIILEGRPVETGRPDVLVPRAGAADHDVVAAFGVHDVGLATAEVDVVADHQIEP
ncbi:hypothetical protein D3C84_430360 [compost metagenome]